MENAQRMLPYAVDKRANLAVRGTDGDLICVADSKEHAEFIVLACNAYPVQTSADAQMQA